MMSSSYLVLKSINSINILLLVICTNTFAQSPLENLAISKSSEIKQSNAENLVLNASQGDINAVQRALVSGVSINSVDSTHHATALHTAAAVGHIKLVELLIDKGADINALDRRGVSPLIAACASGQISSAKALIKAGANINIKPNLAPTALIVAIQTGSVQLVETLLLANAKVDQSDIFRTTPLQAATLTRRENIIKQVEQAIARHQKSLDHANK